MTCCRFESKRVVLAAHSLNLSREVARAGLGRNPSLYPGVGHKAGCVGEVESFALDFLKFPQLDSGESYRWELEMG